MHPVLVPMLSIFLVHITLLNPEGLPHLSLHLPAASFELLARAGATHMEACRGEAEGVNK